MYMQDMIEEYGLDEAKVQAQVRRLQKMCRDYRRKELATKSKRILQVKPIPQTIASQNFVFGGAAAV